MSPKNKQKKDQSRSQGPEPNKSKTDQKRSKKLNCHWAVEDMNKIHKRLNKKPSEMLSLFKSLSGTSPAHLEKQPSELHSCVRTIQHPLFSINLWEIRIIMSFIQQVWIGAEDTLSDHFINSTLLVPDWTTLPPELPQFLLSSIQQGVENLPQRFWSILTR